MTTTKIIINSFAEKGKKKHKQKNNTNSREQNKING